MAEYWVVEDKCGKPYSFHSTLAEAELATGDMDDEMESYAPHRVVHLVEAGFAPDWASPPADTIRDVLSDRELSEDWLSSQLHLEPAEFAELMRGERQIDYCTAEHLEGALGSTAQFWINLELQYRMDLVRLRPVEPELAEVVKEVVEAMREEESGEVYSDEWWPATRLPCAVSQAARKLKPHQLRACWIEADDV